MSENENITTDDTPDAVTSAGADETSIAAESSVQENTTAESSPAVGAGPLSGVAAVGDTTVADATETPLSDTASSDAIVQPPRRAMPTRIEPLTGEDPVLAQEDLYEVDTISAADEEALRAAIAAEQENSSQPVRTAPEAYAEATIKAPTTQRFVPVDASVDAAYLAAAPAVGGAAAPGLSAVNPFPAENADDAAVEPSPADKEETPRGLIDFGLLLLRVFLGVAVLLHGADTLFGIFGGGLAPTERLLAEVGFTSHTNLLAIGGGVAFLVGGALLILGLFTPLAAAAVLATSGVSALMLWALGAHNMLFAYDSAHGLVLSYAVMASTVVLVGPGKWAADARWGWATRPAWGSLIWWIVGLGIAPLLWATLNTQGFPF